MTMIEILELEKKNNAQMAVARARRDAGKYRMDAINRQCSLIASVSVMESHAIIAGMLK